MLGIMPSTMMDLGSRSLQRGNLAGWGQTACPVPGFSKFCLMERSPFDDKIPGTGGQTTVEYCQAVYTDQRLVSTIRRVKVRWSVVGEIHAYDDSVKPAEFRHSESASAHQA